MPPSPYTTLISCADLAGRLGDARWRVFDCRHDLADPAAGEVAYGKSHIPGAAFLHLDRDLSSKPNGGNGRHPLPSIESFAATLSRLGVDDGCQVVAYDASGGMYASRLWWMLRWLGHDAVAVLDGGWSEWTAKQFPVSADKPVQRPAQFMARSPRNWTVDAEAILGNLETRTLRVVDARGPDRFRGENETMDPVGGHIPGAVNRSFRDNLDASGRFRPDQLREAFKSVMAGHPPGAIVHQCGSGVSACHNVLAMEIAGLSGSLLYPGSWSEWCSDPSRPVER